MSEEQGLSELRENMLESLRAMHSNAAEKAVADFTPIEDEFIRAIRLNTDYRRADIDNAFGIALTVETEERRRQIKNARSIGNLPNVAGLDDLWR